MSIEIDPRFASLHPIVLSALRGDEQRMRESIRAIFAEALEEAPGFAREMLQPIFEQLTEGIPAGVFSQMTSTLKVIGDVLRSQERTKKPSDIN